LVVGAVTGLSGDCDLGEECFDAAADLVADGADGDDVEAGMVIELPVPRTTTTSCWPR
jgi:hypothetical protein